jgi:hypothetical protein
MSTSISGLPNFDQQTYENLLQQARAQGVGASQVDNLLLEAVNGGKSFDQAVDRSASNSPGSRRPTARTSRASPNSACCPRPARW